MELNTAQTQALEGLCALVLGGHREEVYQRCKACLEQESEEQPGVPAVLYVLSGQDTDPDDPFGNMADEDKQLVKAQSYLVSTDAGAPCLEDFFWFMDNMKEARGLDFAIADEKFSDEDCIVEWLAELAAQLEGTGLAIVLFDGGSEDYHFAVMDEEACAKAIALFQELTAPMEESYGACVLTKDFQG